MLSFRVWTWPLGSSDAKTFYIIGRLPILWLQCTKKPDLLTCAQNEDIQYEFSMKELK